MDQSFHQILHYNMYEIPRYTYHLDSGNISLNLLNLYCTGPDINDELYPGLQYYKAVCFFDSTREVSKDRYMIYAFGVFMEYPAYTPTYTGSWYFRSDYTYYGNNLYNYDNDTVYVKLYPVTMGENFYAPLRFESLGGASNVLNISFRKPDPFP